MFILCILIIHASLTESASVGQPCPGLGSKNYCQRVGDRCFKLLNSSHKDLDWIEADRMCRGLGLQLPVLKTELDYKNYIAFKLSQGQLKTAFFPLGLSNQKSSKADDWVWVDGSAAEFTNWGPNEPDNITQNKYAYETNQWFDAMNHDKHSVDRIICQQKCTADQICLPGWVSHNAHCYLKHGYPYYTVGAASGFCISAGATLLTIDSKDEAKFIYDTYKVNQTSKCYKNKRAYIALHQDKGRKDWVQSTSEVEFNFLNLVWDKRQKNGQPSGDGRSVELRLDIPYDDSNWHALNDLNGAKHKRSAICELKQGESKLPSPSRGHEAAQEGEEAQSQEESPIVPTQKAVPLNSAQEAAQRAFSTSAALQSAAKAQMTSRVPSVITPTAAAVKISPARNQTPANPANSASKLTTHEKPDSNDDYDELLNEVIHRAKDTAVDRRKRESSFQLKIKEDGNENSESETKVAANIEHRGGTKTKTKNESLSHPEAPGNKIKSASGSQARENESIAEISHRGSTEAVQSVDEPDGETDVAANIEPGGDTKTKADGRPVSHPKATKKLQVAKPVIPVVENEPGDIAIQQEPTDKVLQTENNLSANAKSRKRRESSSFQVKIEENGNENADTETKLAAKIEHHGDAKTKSGNESPSPKAAPKQLEVAKQEPSVVESAAPNKQSNNSALPNNEIKSDSSSQARENESIAEINHRASTEAVQSVDNTDDEGTSPAPDQQSENKRSKNGNKSEGGKDDEKHVKKSSPKTTPITVPQSSATVYNEEPTVLPGNKAREKEAMAEVNQQESTKVPQSDKASAGNKEGQVNPSDGDEAREKEAIAEVNRRARSTQKPGPPSTITAIH